jgi:ABC-type glycerol-3-phosphate transport system permease component
VAYAAALIVIMLALAAFGSSRFPPPKSAGELMLVVAAIGLPTSYGTALLAGAPIYLVLRRVGAVTPLALWIGGAIMGCGVALLLAPRLRGGLFSIPFPLWVGCLLGLLSAEVFRRLLSTRDAERDGSLAG